MGMMAHPKVKAIRSDALINATPPSNQMKIQKVTGVNVKGRSFSHDLKPVNVIVGANAAGKTAVMKTIDLALTQKIAPANYPAIAPLFEGFGNMVVAIETDRGDFTREFTRTGEKISMSCDRRPEGVIIPPVAIDADVYFGLSIDKRTQFVASMVKLPDSFSEHGVVAELKNKLVLPDERNTDTTEEIVSDIIHSVQNSASELQQHGVTMQDWLAQRIAEATVRAKSARDTKQRMENSAQASVQIQLTAPGDDSPDAIATVERIISDMAAKGRTTSEELGKVKAEKDADVGAREKRKARRKELNDQLSKLTDQSEAVLANRKKILVVEKEVSEHISTTPEANMAISDKNVERARFVSGNQNLEQEAARLRQIISGVDKRLCENCQSILKGDSETQLTDTENAIVANNMTISNVATDLKALEDQATKSRAEDIRISNLAKTLPQLRQTLRTAENAQQSRTTLHTQLQELGDPALDNNEVTRDYDTEIKKLSDQLEESRQQYSALQDRLKKATAAAQQNARKAQEEAERVKAVDDYDLQVIALDVLKEFQAKMVETAFQTLLADANLIADAVLKTPLAYKDGEIGRYDEQQRWVSHRCFSGTEQAATFAAMSFALATTSACRIVRVDELGRLDATNKEKFVKRMVQLVNEGKVDQAIFVDTTAQPYDIDGVHIIRV